VGRLDQADLSQGDVWSVWAVSPPPGGGTSARHSLTILNPVPTLVAVVPDTIPVGSADATLTITGSAFVETAIVLWNSQALQSTWVSSIRMTAVIGAASLVTPGTFTLRVRNTTPGGGDSAPLAVVVR